MPRYVVTLEYDGGPFVGWQRQANGLSVQEALENAVFALSGERVAAGAAGRTDAGVHALAMPAQFDLARDYPVGTVRDALNFHLRPAPVCVLDARVAPPNFHVRFSATRRRYLYRILNRRAPPALDAGRVWPVLQPIDEGVMSDAAARLLGRHDFTTFRAAECQSASPIKTLDRLDVWRDGDIIEVRAEALSFLHHQVRSMVGTIVEAGLGRRSPDDVAAALAARDRKRCGRVAPPQGLYFVSADYPPEA